MRLFLPVDRRWGSCFHFVAAVFRARNAAESRQVFLEYLHRHLMRILEPGRRRRHTSSSRRTLDKEQVRTRTHVVGYSSQYTGIAGWVHSTEHTKRDSCNRAIRGQPKVFVCETVLDWKVADPNSRQ